ncbi:MAG: alpha/beta hydrolase family protein [Capsulimonadaceae bacterium]
MGGSTLRPPGPVGSGGNGTTLSVARAQSRLRVYGLAIVALVVLFLWSIANRPPPAVRTSIVSVGTFHNLAEARKAHPTRLMVREAAPQTYAALRGVGQAVTYRCDGRVLTAWLIKPDLPGRRPGILYCHNGFALTSNDISAVQPFVDAGYAVLLPAYRGENGNSGSFEMFYGEVDDARAALDALATVPTVDPNYLFVVGEGAGGTVAMLLAESGAPLRAAAACSGIANYHAPQLDVPAWSLAPFDWKNPVEDDLRSAARHVDMLSCPLYLYYGADETENISCAQSMPEDASDYQKTVTLTILPNSTQANVLVPALEHVISDFSPIYAPYHPEELYHPAPS